MSQSQDFILPDGRKTSDLKVVDLKKELDKIGVRKSGTKSELLTRLNEALSANPNLVDDHVKEHSVESNDLISQRKIINKSANVGVDLDDSDDMRHDGVELNQSMDTLELRANMDDSLNPVDDNAQEDQIQISLSKDEEAEMNLEEKDERIVVREPENEEENNERKRNMIENEPDEMLNIEMDTTLEMYEGDNTDLDMEERDGNKDIINEDETITVTVRNEVNKKEEGVNENMEEAEEGEVVTVPIAARLGKRKVTEENDSDLSPKKTKKKGLRETKGTGHIIEEPLRVQSPQKSKSIISDILRVDHLVRPFTMTQLQDVLSLKGRVIDLWLNKIKSIAYVKYESESAAINARESLDGCKWPSINPKLLVADFATFKEMEWMKEKGDSGVNPPAYLRQQDVPSKPNNDIDPTQWRNVDNAKPMANDRPIKDNNNQENKPRIHSAEKKRRHDNAKEGNKEGHKDGHKEVHRDGHKEGHRHGNKEKTGDKSKEKNKKAPAAKLLEDLFRKTVTQPAIYWLPVSREKKDETKKMTEWKNVASE